MKAEVVDEAFAACRKVAFGAVLRHRDVAVDGIAKVSGVDTETVDRIVRRYAR